jgi:hypothetical protein
VLSCESARDVKERSMIGDGVTGARRPPRRDGARVDPPPRAS